MHDDLLPLFPLAVVLLPHNRLPLHIFEERYKLMIGEVLASGGEFGVVLAAGQGLMTYGCTATVEQVMKEYPDGRLDIMALGRRRFSIEEVNTGHEYLRAGVTYFDDEEHAAHAALRERAISVCRSLPVRDDAGDTDEAVDDADPQLSFQLARRVTDLEFRQQLLGMRSEPARLERLIDYVPRYIQHSYQAAHLKEVAGKNGHGNLPPGLMKGA
jgi:Lon protease-like protein